MPGGETGGMSYLDFDGTSGRWKLNKEPVDGKILGRILVPRAGIFEGCIEWANGSPLQKDPAAAVHRRRYEEPMSERLLQKPLSPGAYRKDSDGPTLVYGFFGVLIDDGVNVVLEKNRWGPQRRSTPSRPRLLRRWWRSASTSTRSSSSNSSSYDGAHRTIYDPKLNIIGYVTDARVAEVDVISDEDILTRPAASKAKLRRERPKNQLSDRTWRGGSDELPRSFVFACQGACHGRRRHRSGEHRQGGRRDRRSRRQRALLLPDPRGRFRAHALAGAFDHRRSPHPGALPIEGLRQEAFREIKADLVRKGLPEEQIGGTRKGKELPAWDYFTADGRYSWTKQKQLSKAGRKSFTCGRWDHQANDWIERKRPADAVMLFNLQSIAPVLAVCRTRRSWSSRARRTSSPRPSSARSRRPMPTAPASGASTTPARSRLGVKTGGRLPGQ